VNRPSHLPEGVGSPSLRFVYRSASATHRGHVRSHNEDAFLLRPDLGVWAVADGMGGHERGDYASRQVAASLETMGSEGSLAALVEAAEDAILSVHQHLRERGLAVGSVIGSTVVALLLREGHAVVLWAGDSRAYRLRNGLMYRLSHDHSVVQSLIDQGLLEATAAADHPLANRITRAVGAGDTLHLEMELLPICAGDRFLLCSDGLDRHVADEEIASLLAANHDPEACAKALLDKSLALGGSDNITCLVVDITTASVV